MKVRRHHESEDLRQSFVTSVTLPATLYALREYMQSYSLDGKLSETELSSIKFRHRSLDRQKTDTEPPLAGVKAQWPAAWQIVYLKDGDRIKADETAHKTSRKAHYTLTTFGYCEHIPIA
jgi:hypothetical protein